MYIYFSSQHKHSARCHHFTTTQYSPHCNFSVLLDTLPSHHIMYIALTVMSRNVDGSCISVFSYMTSCTCVSQLLSHISC